MGLDLWKWDGTDNGDDRRTKVVLELGGGGILYVWPGGAGVENVVADCPSPGWLLNSLE